MSIINNANPGSSVEALHAVDRIITKFSQNDKNDGKYLPLDTLMSLVAPNSLFRGTERLENGEFKRLDAEKKVKQTIKFWGDAGLWNVTEQGVRSTFLLDNTRDLPKRLLKLIASKDFDLLKGNDIEPFLRFVIFFLCIDEVTFVGLKPLDGNKAGELVASLINSDAVYNAMSLNSNERPNFFAYARMMGFLEQVGKKQYFVDPTRAIKTFLPQVFENSNSLFFDDFLNKLNHCLPVFDEGKYRELVEQQMILNTNLWPAEKGVKLSASLSIAIERLTQERIITCSLASDSVIRYSLTLPNGQEKMISTIQFLGGKS
ncbi:protein DpdG [Aliivibrio fischeri]|uniref:protein DpdG n=1 Tax=Aliivibrio fischeri TaxID=668 RepID=UPI0007C563AE|nr:protein DpdG [Aliivibrio fischeri]